MAELKTKKTSASAEDFLNTNKEEQKRKDSLAILKMMQEASGEKPKMWGTAMIGFGDRHLKYESGRELDWFVSGFSPRKQNITLYLCGGLQEELAKKLGKYKTGKGCLYINKLEDVDVKVLRKMIERSFRVKQ
jgi:hypothetical protein